jgi:hypothetical protein
LAAEIATLRHSSAWHFSSSIVSSILVEWLNLEGCKMGSYRKRVFLSFIAVFLALNVMINIWPLAAQIPALTPVLVFPAIIWIHIPGIILGPILGESQFVATDITLVPKTALAWAAVILFWQLVTAVLAALATLFGMLFVLLITPKAARH